MSDVQNNNIPIVPINEDNRVLSAYGTVFRMGEDRYPEQVETNSWFLGYIIDKYTGVSVYIHILLISTGRWSPVLLG